jgi:hypothetical protein
MNVEIGAEAALFPEKEYIEGIFVAVQPGCHLPNSLTFFYGVAPKKTLVDSYE